MATTGMPHSLSATGTWELMTARDSTASAVPHPKMLNGTRNASSAVNRTLSSGAPRHSSSSSSRTYCLTRPTGSNCRSALPSPGW